MNAVIQPIKAIVLSCDRYRELAEHMVHRYEELWPGHPFRFRIPYQELAPSMQGWPVEFRQTPQEIKPTVLSLIADLDDREWIYWCIDDKYPAKLNIPKILQAWEWLNSSQSQDASGLLFCRCRRMWDPRCLTGRRLTDNQDNVYLERSSYAQIWIHQFVRVKVLRHLFKGFPDEIPFPRYLDPLKNEMPKPPDHRLYVTRLNLAVFGESAESGLLTRNCLRSMQRNGLNIPTWVDQVTSRNHYVGQWHVNTRQRLRYLVGGLTGRMPDFFY